MSPGTTCSKQRRIRRRGSCRGPHHRSNRQERRSSRSGRWRRKGNLDRPADEQRWSTNSWMECKPPRLLLPRSRPASPHDEPVAPLDRNAVDSAVPVWLRMSCDGSEPQYRPGREATRWSQSCCPGRLISTCSHRARKLDESTLKGLCVPARRGHHIRGGIALKRLHLLRRRCHCARYQARHRVLSQERPDQRCIGPP